jgi:hypothetical protein
VTRLACWRAVDLARHVEHAPFRAVDADRHALEGVVVVRSARAERRIAASDFFVDLYTAALAPGELVAACEMPMCESGDVFGFDEIAVPRECGQLLATVRTRW